MTMEETHRRRDAVETIHDVVSAMRAIAAGRIQGAQRALAAAKQYEQVVVRGIDALPPGLRHLPEPAADAGMLLVVLMSEQALCGAFNQELLPLIERRRDAAAGQGPVSLLVVGQRGARQLAAHGIIADEVLPAATALAGLRDLGKQVAGRMTGPYAAGRLGSVHVLYQRYCSLSEHLPAEVQVLPVDLSESVLPGGGPARRVLRYLPEATLLAGLISELAFIRLYRIAAEAYASEQAARLVAMDGAARNTDRLLRELTDLEQRERQGEITRQVLELISARFAVR